MCIFRRNQEHNCAETEGVKQNKAGYMANTRRGQGSKGGNANFQSFKLDQHGWMVGLTDQQTDGQSLFKICESATKNNVVTNVFFPSLLLLLLLLLFLF